MKPPVPLPPLMCIRVHPLLPVLLLAGLPSALLSHGGPPFITNDPGTPGAGRWEINLAWTAERRPGESVRELPLLDVNYGVGKRIELNYNVACLRTAAGGAAKRGLGNSGVGLKWRFLGGADSHFTMSVAPQFEFRTPGSKAARRGLVDDENTFILPLQLARDFGWIGISAEAGRTFPSKSSGGWFGGLAAGRQLTERVSLGVDLHGGWDGRGRNESLVLLAGARLELGGSHTLLLSAGRELRNRHAPRATLMGYVGWQLTL